MVKQIPNFIANKILTANDLIQLWKSICEDKTLGYDGSTRNPKSEFNIGDLTAIINGSLVANILMRTGGKLQNYSSAGALLGEITVDNLILSSANFNKNYLEDFSCASNTTNPTYQVDVNAGKCLAKDKLTIIELASLTVADLTNHITPSANTTYHLYAYKHSGTGVTLVDFSTSLIPTAGTGVAQLPNLDGTKYRRIDSNKTDGSGNLRRFFSIEEGGGSLIKRYDTWINDFLNNPTITQTLTTCSIPLGFKLLVKFGVVIVALGTVGGRYRLYSPDTQDIAVTSSNSTFANGNATTSSDAGSQVEVLSNTSGQIAHRSNYTSGTLYINTIGYTDYRLNN